MTCSGMEMDQQFASVTKKTPQKPQHILCSYVVTMYGICENILIQRSLSVYVINTLQIYLSPPTPWIPINKSCIM